MMTRHSTLFDPSSIAIVGISRSTPSLGRMILDNIQTSSYSGDVYLVNPKASEIANMRVYNTIEDLPQVDVAVLLVPPKYTPQTLSELAKKNCKYALIITAGFESAIVAELQEIVKATGIRIMGPNSMGFFSIHHNSSFMPLPITAGKLGYISQSGSIIAVVQEHMTAHRIGFSAFVSLGNKLDLKETEFFVELGQDPATSIVAGYLESFSDPRQLRQILTDLAQKKPIILVKGGRTSRGSKAVSSHTGALAGNYRLTRSLLKSAGVMLSPTIEEQVSIARFIDQYGISKHDGIVTISSAGGPGVLAADETIEYGLPLADLAKETIQQLDMIIPPFGSSHNPVDLVADAGIERYLETIKILDRDPAVSTMIVIIVHPVLIDTEPLLDALNSLNIKKPVIAAYLGPDFAKFDTYDQLLVYRTTEEIIRVLTYVNTYHQWKQTVDDRLNRDHLSEKPTLPKLTSPQQVHQLLRSIGYTYPATLITANKTEAKAWFDLQDRAVVMKLDHPQFSHKTDVGGVLLDLDTEDKFSAAWDRLQKIYENHGIKAARNIELQPYFSNGIELVLGIIHDEQFGHFIMIGAGGTNVELVDDTVFLPTPLSRFEVLEAIKQLDIYAVLTGYRGSASIDIEMLVDKILYLDQLVAAYPQITELDINPLYCIPETDEFIVLDARMALE